MNPLLLIGAGVLVWYLLKGSAGRALSPGDLLGYNQRVQIELIGVRGSNAVLRFTLKPEGGKFKNNRLAGTLYLGENRLADFRNPRNFTVNNTAQSIEENILIPAQYTQLMETNEFWGQVRAVGNFEARDGERVNFENPILPDQRIYPTPEFSIDFAKIFATGAP
jgi:hypothetical protein